MGERCNIKLMQSVMHFRSKELNIRSAFPSGEVGKSLVDLWNKCYRIDLDRPGYDKNGSQYHNEFLIPVTTTPLSHAIVTDFIDHLTKKERRLLDGIVAGFKFSEISKRLKLSYTKLCELRRSL